MQQAKNILQRKSVKGNLHRTSYERKSTPRSTGTKHQTTGEPKESKGEIDVGDGQFWSTNHNQNTNLKPLINITDRNQQYFGHFKTFTLVKGYHFKIGTQMQADLQRWSVVINHETPKIFLRWGEEQNNKLRRYCKSNEEITEQT